MASSASTSTMEDHRGEVSRLRQRPLFPFFFPSVSGDDDDADDDEQHSHSHSHATHLSCSRLPSSLQLQAFPFPSLPLLYPHPRPFLQFPLPSLTPPNSPLMTILSFPLLSARLFPQIHSLLLLFFLFYSTGPSFAGITKLCSATCLQGVEAPASWEFDLILRLSRCRALEAWLVNAPLIPTFKLILKRNEKAGGISQPKFSIRQQQRLLLAIWQVFMELQKEMLYGIHEDKKRKMKTPLQLEALEQVFAEEKYPSEAVRARLSIQLGLSSRQLKMWFCHRRLKERKSKGEDEEHGSSDRSPQLFNEAPAPSYRHSAVLISPPRRSDYPSHKEEQLSGSSYHSQDDFAWKFRKRVDEFGERDFEISRRKRSRQTTSSGADSLRVAELQAIASVETQLGEPLRWDSPCLGVDFDPLPPGAFSTPTVSFPHWKPSPPRGLGENCSHSKPDSWLLRDPSSWDRGSKSRKSFVTDNGQYVSSRSGSTLLQEYQFIPERPTGRDGMASVYEKSSNLKMLQGSDASRQGLVIQSPLLRGSESLTNAYDYEGTPANAGTGLTLQRDPCNTVMFTQPQFLTQDLLPGIAFDTAHYGGHVNPYHLLPTVSSLRGIEKLHSYDNQETYGGIKKRKSEEIRVSKEVDVHRKRIQKELEREELARWKREEQMQKEREKEVEKLLREKQREDERLLRDKQREDERLQREVKRESERQERFLQKEAQRLEREREKEEARRLKEATRLKAAIERATARRLARECVELIDDERLELLEAAATSQCLPSIYLLDGETLQGLDRYKDFLKKFPPATVKMKKPLAISPWIDSQFNLGHLFMVWRFLIAFADVLGLWPFTVDELVQAFHDYESRLLAEIHIALFKIIEKDIEDMAKASANAGAVNQYTAASAIGGGHTQLVEAAFAWGFDYRNWSRYLNASTWPEVLRQFSLAAGFGGSRWKRGDEGRHTHSKGNAASNAAICLKAKGGGSHIRKCGARLTPGTVKFAAFHVLSVEGSRGLPIVEIVARIEKYGLRDLSTSKTPESSVAAALSRDTFFFDRVAPSTYCVKPAYRKKPEDAERLLQAASERICLFQSGILDACDEEKYMEGSEEGEKEPLLADDVEDFTVDDMRGGQDKGKVTFSLKGGKIVSAGERKIGGCPGKTKTFELHSKNGESRGKHALLSSLSHGNASMQDGREGRAQRDKTLASAVDNEIDESHGGEPWVQGLWEGEYSGLSVEERLNALVALVETVNEGNTVRVALEDRMESATALKRQMWAEAQVDKRRSKEEQLSKLQPQNSGDGVQSEHTNMSPIVRDGKGSDSFSTQADVRKSPIGDKEQGMQDSHYHEISVAGGSSEKSRAQLKVEIDFRADELYVFRSLPLGLDRRRNRYWQFMTSYAAEDPGCGRIFFESSEDGHWEVIDTEEAFSALLANLDTRGVREAHLHGVLLKQENLIRQGMRKLSSKARFEQRLPVNHNEDKAVDKSFIRSSTSGIAVAGPKEEDGSSGDGSVIPESCRHMGAIRIQTGNSLSEKRGVLERYREFDKWFWSKENPTVSFLAAMRLKKKRCSELLAKCDMCHDLYWHEEKHCTCCHTTFEFYTKKDTKYLEHVSECNKFRSERSPDEKLQCIIRKFPCRVQLLKAQFLSIEAAIPAEALRPCWSEAKRRSWASSLKDVSSPSDLLQLLSEVESAIHRDWLSPRFEPAKEIMESDTGAVSCIPAWVPCTTAAVAMRVVELDSALFYSEDQRRKSSQRRKSVPAVGARHVDTKLERSKETGIKQPDTDCTTGKEARDDLSRGSEHQEAVKVKLQGFKKQPDQTGANLTLGSTQEREKYLTSSSLEFEEYSRDLHARKADAKLELHTSDWTRSSDDRTSMSARDDDRAHSGTEEEEVVIEDDFEEEEDAHFEEEEDVHYKRGQPSKDWVAASEGGETDSLGEESMDMNIQDDEADDIGEHYSRNTREINFEEDGDDEDEEVESSDSESFYESE
ncbi:hypothetical protein GOP47_0001414 [Adiantum capillus-veneris]|uniref:Uncharacterized protein n=1 Tax=Adiantum capillus-veneris TaxID=13818 RepID=A0A9D4ZQ21_ADICA|nr:hypothetical protein GOP47_0001414 [Adiantum capillus-veneris]